MLVMIFTLPDVLSQGHRVTLTNTTKDPSSPFLLSSFLQICKQKNTEV